MHRLRNSGIRKQDIEIALLGSDRLIEPVKVTWVTNVPLYSIRADFSHGFAQFGLRRPVIKT